MEIIVLMVGMIQTNCYIVHKEGSSACVVIDPGDEPEKIATYIQRENWNNEAILLTHGHYDHITGVSGLVSLVGGKVYAYEEERELLMDPVMNRSALGRPEVALEPECFVRDGDVLHLADMDFRVIHTPGHTRGGCCYYEEKEKALFSGDTIFMESVGRTDMPTGNMAELLNSVRNKILSLPPEVKIYPGHGPDTNVAYEIENNPFAGGFF